MREWLGELRSPKLEIQNLKRLVMTVFTRCSGALLGSLEGAFLKVRAKGAGMVLAPAIARPRWLTSSSGLPVLSL